MGASDGIPPTFPVPASAYRIIHRLLTCELEAMETEQARAADTNAGLVEALAGRERMEQLLRQEAVRDEAELIQLRGALARHAVAERDPLREPHSPAMDKQQRAVLLEAEQRYRRAKESVALLTRYGADDNEGITADAEYLWQQQQQQQQQQQHQHQQQWQSPFRPPLQAVPPFLHQTPHVHLDQQPPMNPREVHAREVRLLREKDVEMEAALQAQAARSAIELNAAVRAAQGQWSLHARAEAEGDLAQEIKSAVAHCVLLESARCSNPHAATGVMHTHTAEAMPHARDAYSRPWVDIFPSPCLATSLDHEQQSLAAADKARAEERAAFALQRRQRIRHDRVASRSTLFACASALREARTTLSALQTRLGSAENRGRAEHTLLRLALADADVDLREAGRLRTRAEGAEAALAAAEAAMADERSAMGARLKRAVAAAEESANEEAERHRKSVASLRDQLAESRAKQKGAEQMRDSGVAEARQGRKQAEKLLEQIKRKLTDTERAAADAAQAEAAETAKLSAQADKERRNAARAQAQLVKVEARFEALNGQLESARNEIREGEARTRAAELVAEELRQALAIAKERLADAEQAAEATTRGAAAASVAARNELESAHAEMRRMREAAAEAAASAAQAAEAASKREEALEREVLYAREAAAKAEAKADAERRDVSRRIATARVRMEETFAVGDDGGRRAAAGWEEGAEGDPRHRRLGEVMSTADRRRVSPPSSPVSARMPSSSAGSPSGGRRSANGGSDRSALEAVILSLELGKCETLLRESEQRAAYEARRHEATVGPLRLQLEHETAWWRSHLESEVGRLAAELEAQREASEANAASRLEVLRLELDKKDRAIMQHTHDVSALQQQVSTLRSALATTKRADQMDMLTARATGAAAAAAMPGVLGADHTLTVSTAPPAASALASSSLLPSNAFCAPPRHAPHYVAPPPRTNTSTYVHPASPLPPPPLEPTALQGCGAPPTARSYSPLAAPTTTPATDARYLPLSSGAAALAAAAAEAGGGTPAGAPPCASSTAPASTAYALRERNEALKARLAGRHVGFKGL